MEKIGSFEVTSPRLMVSDPCYAVGTWCQGILDNVAPGTYEAFVEQVDGIICKLRIVNECFVPDIKCDEAQSFEVGVDSGCAGFWDLPFYKDGREVPSEFMYGDPGNWWFQMCHDSFFACDPWRHWYVGPHGVHSSSGHGDGGYTCFVARRENTIVAAEIVFIDDEEEI